MDDLLATVPRMQKIAFSTTKPVAARYIRISADRNDALPATFPGDAKNTWLFVDEILIQ